MAETVKPKAPEAPDEPLGKNIPMHMLPDRLLEMAIGHPLAPAEPAPDEMPEEYR